LSFVKKEVVSTEARAFSNAGRCGLTFWTPNINPCRDPRWGRCQEVPSEDSFFISTYVNQLIPGLQGGLTGDPYFKLVATCKHYAGYDIESESSSLLPLLPPLSCPVSVSPAQDDCHQC
jgi:beta-D-xylosidase 4